MEQISLLRDVKYAVEKAGGVSRVADEMVRRGLRVRCTPQAICDWVSRGYAPVDGALLLEELSGVDRENLVSEKLRPLCRQCQ